MTYAEAQPPCDACGETSVARLFTGSDFDTSSTPFDVVACARCGLVRTDPLLSDDALAPWYQAAYYGGQTSKFQWLFEALTRRLQARRARGQIARIRAARGTQDSDAPVRVLDIGCGRGNLLRALAEAGCDAHGVERSDFDPAGFPDNATLHRGPLDSHDFEPGSFDCIVLWHSLEHLRHPVPTLAAATRLLRPGGLLEIAVPDFGSYQARWFGPAWFHLDLPRHLYHFSTAWLQDHLESRGLLLRRASTWVPDQNLYGFVQSALNALPFVRRDNTLYELMKSGRRPLLSPLNLHWLAAAGLLTPFAMVEYVVSGLLGRGATVELTFQVTRTAHDAL